MDKDTMINIINTLFPKHDIRVDRTELELIDKIPMFIVEEASTTKRHPVPTAINRPDALIQIYNKCLADGIFPEVCKEQKLVLISKGKGSPVSQSSYRPLCMLGCAGKLF